MSKIYANNSTFKFLNDLDIDLDVKARLTVNLVNIYNGNSDVYTTPLSNTVPADRILLEWDKILQGNREQLNDVLIDLEESQKSKSGPRSLAAPWKDRREQVDLSYSDNHVNYAPLIAIPEAPRRKGSLRPVSLDLAIKLTKNDTNSGLPFYTRKGKVKSRYLERFEQYLKRRDPCVLFTRTQEQMKTRDVWGFPMADSINEMRFYKPVLDYQRSLHWRSALKGPTAVDNKMSYIIKQAKASGLVIISIDFSNYDRSLKHGLLQKVSEYYKYLFQDKFSDDIDYITNRRSTIGLVTPDGIYTGYHGMPSGSTFTNEDDSIAQFIIAKSSGVLVRDLFDIQGDDGVYAIKPNDVDRFIGTFRKFGLEVNVEKSYKSSDYMIYLQNLYHLQYSVKGEIKGIYPTFRALNRLIYQERWSNFEDYNILGKDYYAIRAISILENCKHHPLFEKFVAFVLKYDKYDLRPSKQGIKQYIKMLNDSSGAEGIINNQYGDNVRGINSFETVKLIRKLQS